jgi:hypothetical protein
MLQGKYPKAEQCAWSTFELFDFFSLFLRMLWSFKKEFRLKSQLARQIFRKNSGTRRKILIGFQQKSNQFFIEDLVFIINFGRKNKIADCSCNWDKMKFLK